MYPLLKLRYNKIKEKGAKFVEELQLSKRLMEIAKLVNQGESLADIGADHAYLLIYLALNNIISKGVISEIAEGPLQNAQQNVAKYGVQLPIDFKLGDGVTTLQTADEVDVITINGMGGKTIVHILEDGYKQNKLAKKLILQPNTDEWEVRFWLTQHQYQIMTEKIIQDKKETYEIICAIKQTEPIKLTRQEIRFGPKLLQEQNDLFIAKYRKQLAKYQQLLTKIPIDTYKYKYIANLAQEIEEMLS